MSLTSGDYYERNVYAGGAVPVMLLAGEGEGTAVVELRSGDARLRVTQQGLVLEPREGTGAATAPEPSAPQSRPVKGEAAVSLLEEFAGAGTRQLTAVYEPGERSTRVSVFLSGKWPTLRLMLQTRA